MVGCRFNAKNTLDKNYLYFAEKRGAKVIAETRVVDIRPLGAADGSDGYELTTERSTAWFAKQRTTITARHVVLAASALGTMDLLMRIKQRGSLPAVSDRLGHDVRTNSESIVGVRFPGKRFDMSKGIAIGSGIHIDRFTHIEATRYSRGSDVLGLIATMLVTRHGLGAYRALDAERVPPSGPVRPRGVAVRVRAADADLPRDADDRRDAAVPAASPLVLAVQRGCCAPTGERIPTNIPARERVRRARRRRRSAASRSRRRSEILFDLPMTAHCIGGCVMGADAAHGVIDAQHRVFGYQNLYVVDGAAVGANLGVNPSLTITALAERAMSFIPDKS